MKAWLADGWLAGIRHLRSPNQGSRPADAQVSLLLIHNISLPPNVFSGDAVERFFTNQLDPAAHPYFSTIAGLQVSAHFLIRRSGRVVQFVACDQRAWHAGKSSWNGRDDCNDFSVGIELQGNDHLPYSKSQYAALWPLIDALRRRYPITAVAGHCHVAAGRKSDPGEAFDWAAVRRRYPALCLPPEVAG
jgi:AmpD protein